jgi:sugar (pentulose or hexulose) kinase
MCSEITRETSPSPENSRQYAELLGIYREIYPQLRETFSRLSRFAAQVINEK